MHAIQGSAFAVSSGCTDGQNPGYCKALIFPHANTGHHTNGSGIDVRYLNSDSTLRERFDRFNAKGKRDALTQVRNYLGQLRELDIDCLTGPIHDRPEKCIHNGQLKFTGKECFMNRELINLVRTSDGGVVDADPLWLLDPEAGDPTSRRQSIPSQRFYENCPYQESFTYSYQASSTSTHFAIDDVLKYQFDMHRGFRRLRGANIKTIYYTSDGGGFSIPEATHIHARTLIGKVLKLNLSKANGKVYLHEAEQYLNFEYPLYRFGTVVPSYDPFGLDLSGSNSQFVPNSNGVLRDVSSHADHLHIEAD